MNEYYYSQALKLGQKEARACAARGESTCLPVLDDFIPEERIVSGTDLGIVQIPAEFIVGTKSRGRVNAFAPNFMPLVDLKSEFADKWNRLCEAHLEEGIRDPILAFEYMNRYYVSEGNKRVSVLKFFGAPQITGHVIRVLPERTPETELYYEFVGFYRLSGINYLEFSKPGSCAALQSLLGKPADEVWTEEERKQFFTAWFWFREAYEGLGGKNLRTTVGDAMLAYMEIYGYPSIRGKSAQEIKTSLSKFWEELLLLQEEEPIDVKLDPAEKKPGIVQKVLGTEPKPTEVAFVHDGDISTSGWTRSHERGREYVQRVLEGKIRTHSYFGGFDCEPGGLIDRAIEDGNTVIFTTSPRLINDSLRAAVEHPEVTVFNCSLNMSHRYIRTYYARMYEVKFILGAVAGALAGSDPVGYLADYPIFGQIAGINAFALGAQMTNPGGRVILEWSAVGGTEAALGRIREQGVRLISSQDLRRMGREGSESLGLSLITEGERVNLATPLWQWGSYYEQLLRLVRSRSDRSEYAESRRALNYYWGMSAGVVELRCSKRLPPETRKLAEVLQSGIRAGLCDPFRGPLYAQDGLILPEGETLAPDEIIRMEWLAENVAGSIPAYDELTLGKGTVDMMGVSETFRKQKG